MTKARVFVTRIYRIGIGILSGESNFPARNGIISFFEILFVKSFEIPSTLKSNSERAVRLARTDIHATSTVIEKDSAFYFASH